LRSLALNVLPEPDLEGKKRGDLIGAVFVLLFTAFVLILSFLPQRISVRVDAIWDTWFAPVWSTFGSFV